MNKTAATFLLAVLSMPFLLSAQEKAPAQAPVTPLKPKDYGAGFEKFYQFGLPDVKDARYVKLDAWMNMYIDKHSIFNKDVKLKGDAWLIEENKGGKSKFIVIGCLPVELYDEDVLKKIRKEELEELQKQTDDKRKKIAIELEYNANEYQNSGRFGGAKWKDADIRQDLARIIEYLAEFEKFSDKEEKRKIDENECVIFLFTAIHAYRKGFKDEANRIAETLFEKIGSRQKVIKAAINRLADARYDDIMERFFIDGNWKQLSKRLDELVSTFDSAWVYWAAVKRVADDVRKRASSQAIPEITGEGITNEDWKLASELADVNQKKLLYFANSCCIPFYQYDDLWIIKDEKSLHKKYASENVVDRIIMRGMKSMPLLIALLKDTCLVNVDVLRIKQRDPRFYDHENIESSDPPEIITEKLYRTLRRPAMRQDLALCILDPLIPGPEREELHKLGMDAAYKRYSELYSDIKDKTSIEIAKLYLSNIGFGVDDYKQFDTAMKLLIEKGDEKDFQFLENMMSIEERSGRDDSYIMLYAVKRGAKAKKYLEDGIEALKRRYLNNSDVYGRCHDRELVSVLKDAISPRTDQKLIEDLLSGEEELPEIWGILENRMRIDNSKDRMNLILNAIVDVKDPEVSHELIDNISSLYYYYLDNKEKMEWGVIFDEKIYFDEDCLKAPPSPVYCAEAWKKVFADRREFNYSSSDDEEDMKKYEELYRDTVGELALYRFEWMYANSSTRGSYNARILGEERVNEISRMRCEQILEGRNESEIQQYPSAGNVPEERTKEILEKLKSADDVEVVKQVASLSDDEKIAIALEIKDGMEILLKLTGIANRILAIESEVPEWSDLKEIEGMKGKPLNKETCEKMFETCRRLALDGKAVKCEIRREPFLGGVSIRLSKMSEGNDKNVDSSEYIVGENRRRCHAWWPLREEKKSQVKKVKDEIDEEEKVDDADKKNLKYIKERTDYWEDIGKIFSGERSPFEQIKITFHGHPAGK